MKIELLLFACAYVGVTSLTTSQVSPTSAEDNPSSMIPTTTVTTPTKPTTPGVIIAVPTVRTVTPPPRETVFTCEAVTLACPNKYTVVIDAVYHGRRRDPGCTGDIPECCPSTRNDTIDCYERKDSLLSIQQQLCAESPGGPCPILKPSGSPIANCGPGELLSYFRMIIFHCIYIPTTTSNITTVPVTSTVPIETTQTTTPSTRPISTAQVTATPSPSTEDELPIPIIAGAGGGGVLLILLIILIVCCHRRRRQRNKREDMTKPDKGIIPVKDIGVNYMDAEKANHSSDPDIIKTAAPNEYVMY